jgi:hypothetical protein
MEIDTNKSRCREVGREYALIIYGSQLINPKQTNSSNVTGISLFPPFKVVILP